MVFLPLATMKTGDFRESLTLALSRKYGKSEAFAIATTFIAHHLNLIPSQVSQKATTELSDELMATLNSGKELLLQGVPVQYVLETAWFLDLPFYVNNKVLIPRPETEELVILVSEYLKNQNRKHIQLLDLGTGSGCIPIALQKKHPDLIATATDVSEEALEVAKYNAERLKAKVHFIQHDMSASAFPSADKFDVIISNPPYIPPSEKSEMQEHVTNYEPHLALFTPFNDPLFFYKSIAAIAAQHLKEEGSLFLEIHYDSGIAVKELLVGAGLLNVVVKQDISGNDRFVIATR